MKKLILSTTAVIMLSSSAVFALDNLDTNTIVAAYSTAQRIEITRGLLRTKVEVVIDGQVIEVTYDNVTAGEVKRSSKPLTPEKIAELEAQGIHVPTTGTDPTSSGFEVTAISSSNDGQSDGSGYVFGDDSDGNDSSADDNGSDDDHSRSSSSHDRDHSSDSSDDSSDASENQDSHDSSSADSETHDSSSADNESHDSSHDSGSDSDSGSSNDDHQDDHQDDHNDHEDDNENDD